MARRFRWRHNGSNCFWQTEIIWGIYGHVEVFLYKILDRADWVLRFLHCDHLWSTVLGYIDHVLHNLWPLLYPWLHTHLTKRNVTKFQPKWIFQKSLNTNEVIKPWDQVYRLLTMFRTCVEPSTIPSTEGKGKYFGCEPLPSGLPFRIMFSLTSIVPNNWHLRQISEITVAHSWFPTMCLPDWPMYF